MNDYGDTCHPQAQFYPQVSCGFTSVGWHEALQPKTKAELHPSVLQKTARHSEKPDPAKRLSSLDVPFPLDFFVAKKQLNK